jgi:preprotein translocase subunit SecY
MYTVLAQLNPEPMPEIESDAVQDAVNNILANRSLLGTVRVDLASLNVSPHIYAKIMWGFLNEMETAISKMVVVRSQINTIWHGLNKS